MHCYSKAWLQSLQQASQKKLHQLRIRVMITNGASVAASLLLGVEETGISPYYHIFSDFLKLGSKNLDGK